MRKKAPKYHPDFASPPAPIAVVTVRNPITRKSVIGIPLLIDTGADATLILRAILPYLEISEDGLEPTEYSLVGFDGTKSPAVLVPVEMEFLSKRLAGEYILTEANYGVLGRDVLNLFRLIFDGPNQNWEEFS